MKRPDFRKTLELISAKSGQRLHQTFESFCCLVACAVSHGQREDEYLEEAGRWKREYLELFSQALAELVAEMEDKPFVDVLGPMHEELGSKKGKQWGGEFYTPRELSVAIARMLGVQFPERGPIEMHEPAVGSGSMVLAYAEYLVESGYTPLNMRVQAWDVSRLACNMAYINFSLWSIPAEIVWGNTLSLKANKVWRTLWWYAAHGASQAKQQAAIAGAMALLSNADQPQGTAEPTPEASNKPTTQQQKPTSSKPTQLELFDFGGNQ